MAKKKIIVPDDKIIEIKNLYQQGLTIKEISLQLKIKKRYVSKSLKGLTKSGRFIGTTIEDVFRENSLYNRSNLRARVIKEKLINYKCAICGIDGYWNYNKLTLQIDHINGNGTDHRIENLRFLCPNCHSQTETFGARNYKANKKNILFNIPINELKEIIKSSTSLSDICKKCNLPIRSHLFSYLKEFFDNENIDASHILNRFQTQRKSEYKIPINKLLVRDCKHHNVSVKFRIIKENLLPYKCALCDLVPIWNNKELIFHLDHINGINNDNRIENLRLLCYNCHSQTPTFGIHKNK
jgi:5-methylcytosine-specific restriction endonuclease McrA